MSKSEEAAGLRAHARNVILQAEHLEETAARIRRTAQQYVDRAERLERQVEVAG